MPKRKVPAKYQPPALDFDYSPFDKVALKRMISAARLEAKLGDPDARKRTLLLLNSAAIYFPHNQDFVPRPARSVVVDSFNRSDRR